MKKIYVLAAAVFVSFFAIYLYAYETYQSQRHAMELSGTILANRWKEGNGSHVVLVNPESPEDYVEFPTEKLRKAFGIQPYSGVTDGESLFFLFPDADKKNIYHLGRFSERGMERFPYDFEEFPSRVGTVLLNDSLLFVRCANVLYVLDKNTGQQIYQYKVQGQLTAMRLYKDGVVFQEENQVLYAHRDKIESLFIVPSGFSFTGWYKNGEEILIANRKSGTYIHHLSSGHMEKLGDFIIESYGDGGACTLLYLLPKAGSGAQFSDFLYSWNYWLGGDILYAWCPSLYDRKTGIVINLDPSMHDPKAWLSMPYDEVKFGKLRDKLLSL